MQNQEPWPPWRKGPWIWPSRDLPISYSQEQHQLGKLHCWKLRRHVLKLHREFNKRNFLLNKKVSLNSIRINGIRHWKAGLNVKTDFQPVPGGNCAYKLYNHHKTARILVHTHTLHWKEIVLVIKILSVNHEQKLNYTNDNLYKIKGLLLGYQMIAYRTDTTEFKALLKTSKTNLFNIETRTGSSLSWPRRYLDISLETLSAFWLPNLRRKVAKPWRRKWNRCRYFWIPDLQSNSPNYKKLIFICHRAFTLWDQKPSFTGFLKWDQRLPYFRVPQCDTYWKD